MLRMLTRRVFGRLMTASLAVHAFSRDSLKGQTPRDSGATGPQFSVMIWTLKDHGTFEENLERVAQAGYHHVELVGEFKRWSGQDTQRILARMQALKITIDAMAGMTLGFADPSGEPPAPANRSMPVGRPLLMLGMSTR